MTGSACAAHRPLRCGQSPAPGAEHPDGRAASARRASRAPPRWSGSFGDDRRTIHLVARRHVVAHVQAAYRASRRCCTCAPCGRGGQRPRAARGIAASATGLAAPGRLHRNGFHDQLAAGHQEGITLPVRRSRNRPAPARPTQKARQAAVSVPRYFRCRRRCTAIASGASMLAPQFGDGVAGQARRVLAPGR